VFNPTGLEQSILFDKHSFANIVAKDIDIEIHIREEANADLRSSLSSTRNTIESYTRYKDDIPAYKKLQLEIIAQYISDASQLRSTNLALIKSLKKALERLSRHAKSLTKYGISFIKEYFEEQLGRLDRRANEINRSIETYERDRNSMEHTEDDELRDTLHNLISINRKLASDYELSISENKLKIAELKILKNLAHSGKLMEEPQTKVTKSKRKLLATI